MRYTVIYLLASAFFLSIASSAPAQTPAVSVKTQPHAYIRSVRVTANDSGPVLEITSSQPLTPDINRVENPSRLVIDLPNSILAWNKKKINFSSSDVFGVRVDQYQSSPPVTRIVVDLLQPVTYTWDANGDQLMIRLRRSDAATAKPPSVPSMSGGAQPAAVPVSPGSSGAVVLAGSRISAGSSITAGSDAAVLRLQRGGEVRVCPGTTVSVNPSKNGQNLMLGMSTGALEADYMLSASADSVLTPDFRILLAGPGEFHYAISADSRGDTCIRSLPGNSASVIVSELLGDGTYQVKPNQQVTFRSGRVASPDSSIPPGCGCPEQSAPVSVATNGTTVTDTHLPQSVKLAQPGDEKPVAPPQQESSDPGSNLPQSAISVLPPETAPLPASKPDDVHVQVEAPFVFRASDMPAKSSGKPVPSVPEIAALPASFTLRPAPFQPAALPPTQARQKHGFFGRIKGFFTTVFS